MMCSAHCFACGMSGIACVNLVAERVE